MDGHTATAGIGSDVDAYAKDPICGMVVKKSGTLSTERGGHIYYFCSPACQRTFEDPERELKSMRTRDSPHDCPAAGLPRYGSRGVLLGGAHVPAASQIETGHLKTG